MKNFSTAVLIGLTVGVITIGLLAIQPNDLAVLPPCVYGNTNLQYLWSPEPSRMSPNFSIRPVINCTPPNVAASNTSSHVVAVYGTMPQPLGTNYLNQ